MLVALCAALPAGPGCGDEGAPTDGDVRDDGQRDADGETIDVVDGSDRADGVDDGPPDVPPETGDDAGPTDDGGEPAGVVVGLTTRSFTYDGVETFVLAASYYGGCATAEAVVVADLGQLAALGFNNVRIWVTWNALSIRGWTASADGGTGRRWAAGSRR